MPSLPIPNIDSQLDKSKNFQAMKQDLAAIRVALESLLKLEQEREK